MSDYPLLIEDNDAIRTITVNRPDKLNALNSATLSALLGAFEDADGDDSVRVIILTGAGPKAFVAGADISEMATISALEGREFSLLGQRVMRRIEVTTKPVIAMVNGFALGGGLELAMGCHLRIASETAKVGQPEINLGLIPGFGGTQRLLRLCGRGPTLELCLTGTPIDAQRALALGVVNKVVPAADLRNETLAIAGKLAKAAPVALRGILESVVHGGETALEEGLAFETAQFALLFATEDMREGTSAFLERRTPEFRNR